MSGLQNSGIIGATIVVYAVQQATIAAEPIPYSYLQVAVEYRIPSEILYGIALAESGQRLNSNKVRPWPWTLNVAGVPRRYPTRLAAWQSLNYFLQNGIDSIDIGLMQVNWRYHHDKLGTSWAALDPLHNVRTGAKILLSEYLRTGDWRQAIGRYHSPGTQPAQKRRAKQYTKRVSQ